MKIMRNKDFILTIIILILIPLGFISYIKFNNYQIENCKKQNGKVVTKFIGVFDRCILGGNNE